jgi:hypothetical protein
MAMKIQCLIFLRSINHKIYSHFRASTGIKISVRQRALSIFSNIEGLDDVKEMMLRALESPERAHKLLV